MCLLCTVFPGLAVYCVRDVYFDIKCPRDQKGASCSQDHSSRSHGLAAIVYLAAFTSPAQGQSTRHGAKSPPS